jgi:nucleotide-binding universal stress UspA family protein
MTLERVLLALGKTDVERLDLLAETTADIAGPAGAEVVLLHVFDPDEYTEIQDRLGIDPNSETTPDNVAARYDPVRAVGAALDERNVEYSVRGITGDKGEAIVRSAKRENVHLVVVGGRKRSPTGKAVFGSTAQEVMLKAPCPVTFVKGPSAE